MSILLTTLNARYTHSALGLRYLYANMGDLKDQTRIQEFVIGASPQSLAEAILSTQPRIVTFGVYIWNTLETTHLVSLLKKLSPETMIILGGPEVSHETENQPIVAQADYVVTGYGEITTPELCRQILSGKAPSEKIHRGIQAPLETLKLPYDGYTDEDIAQRTLYVEASRGCPFRCEFCLSSLDKTAWSFELKAFLSEMEKLYARGARQFKFVDRTFNLSTERSLAILDFFLEKLNQAPHDPVFAHFEVIPDRLPEALRSRIRQFPEGTLQLEIGVQTFNPDVQTRISRRQNNAVSEENIRWLVQETHAHLHTDLIIGLPGENMHSFGEGFDRLIALEPHEIQVGILKRLRGTPILRHEIPHQLIFDSLPPYSILATDCIDFMTMQRLTRFARYWDMIGNSGRFPHILKLILAQSPFSRFMAFSDWLYDTTGATHQIALERLVRLVCEWLLLNNLNLETIEAAFSEDYAGRFYNRPNTSLPSQKTARKTGGLERQQRHISVSPQPGNS